LENLIRELKLESHVQLLGGRPQHEVAALLAEADLFVLPSTIARTDRWKAFPSR
jgi:glycosyltransferase involved in cell wall biosynthesis